MKSYYCEICKAQGKSFSGIRSKVREHLREEHFIRGKRKSQVNINIKFNPSNITKRMGSIEI